MFEEVGLEYSSASKSSSPSLVDDDSVADQHYNPAKDAGMLMMKRRRRNLDKETTRYPLWLKGLRHMSEVALEKSLNQFTKTGKSTQCGITTRKSLQWTALV